MSRLDPKKKNFDLVVHRNGFTENVSVAEESKWLALALVKEMYPGASVSLVAGGKK